MEHTCKNCYYMDVDFATCFCWLHDIEVNLGMWCDGWRAKYDMET